jgi:hypothetical protein
MDAAEIIIVVFALFASVVIIKDAMDDRSQK